MVRKAGPPLTTKLSVGDGKSFTLICHNVLKREAQEMGYRFEPFNDASGDPFGLDAISYPASGGNFEGQKGRVGFNYFFKTCCANDFISKINEDIKRAFRYYNTNKISLLICVFPEDLQKDKREKIEVTIIKMELPFNVHFYGNIELHNLFIKYPEMVLDYYPQLMDEKMKEMMKVRDEINQKILIMNKEKEKELRITRIGKPITSIKGKVLKELRKEFNYQCGYCSINEADLGGPKSFQIDHYRPISRFPELANEKGNLIYTCSICNNYKSNKWPTNLVNARILNPRTDDYSKHIKENEKFELEPLTEDGKITINILHLNRKQLLFFRESRKLKVKIKNNVGKIIEILKVLKTKDKSYLLETIKDFEILIKEAENLSF